MMKLAWLCYHGSYEKDHYPVILFVEPERGKYKKNHSYRLCCVRG